ncbi:MAG: PorV/PorQ family protein, partial [Elusimicrobiota bacterium]
MSCDTAAVAAVLLFITLVARAASPTSADFLGVGVGPRPVALGEAYVGLADDGYAAAYNPAGLAGLRRQEASFAYNRHLQGVAQQELHYALPTADLGTFGLAATSLQVSPFAGYDANDQPAGKVSAQDLAVGAQYALSRGPLMLGVGGKFLDLRLADAKASGTAWDGGVLYQLGTAVRLGMSVANLGQSLKFDREAFPLPRVFRFGVSGRLDMIGKSYLILTAQASLPNDHTPYPAAGLEFCREDLFALRAGYTGRLDIGQGWSVGGSFKLIHNGEIGRYENIRF